VEELVGIGHRGKKMGVGSSVDQKLKRKKKLILRRKKQTLLELSHIAKEKRTPMLFFL
jgi:hypothetical protein